LQRTNSLSTKRYFADPHKTDVTEKPNCADCQAVRSRLQDHLLNKCLAVTEMGDRLATTDMSRKLGGCAPFFEGELGPHLTQRCLGRGLPSYQVASWFIQPFRYNRHGRKVGGCDPFRGGAGSSSNTMSPWPRPTSVPSGILMHPAIWPQ